MHHVKVCDKAPLFKFRASSGLGIPNITQYIVIFWDLGVFPFSFVEMGGIYCFFGNGVWEVFWYFRKREVSVQPPLAALPNGSSKMPL